MRRTMWIALAMLVAASASAHESQPGLLDLREVAPDRYEVLWRAPLYFGRPHPARLELPAGWKTVVGPSESMLSDSQLFRSVVVVAGGNGVESAVIRFPGLEQTITDVFVRLRRSDGSAVSIAVRPSNPEAQLRGDRPWYAAAADTVAIGFHHILLGLDHLLFVLGLLLIVKGRWMLLKTVTAFTVAHSITLAIATLGYARAPLAPLNASIALSIMFLGPEIVRSWRGETSLTIEFPWVVAFLFGLLHGFGFASGLATAGMSRAELPLALLSFNVGVELGQLVFVAAALALAKSFKTLEVQWPRWAEVLPGYAVGSLGAYWTLQRTAMLIGGLR